MHDTASSVPGLPEGLADELRVEVCSPEQARRFPCRGLIAYSSERHTAYGVFRGQIGLADVPVFSAAMHSMLTENLSKVILNFADVQLTKSALGALVAFAAAVHGRNKRLYLYRCSAQVRAVLRELGLLRFFSLLETEDDIIATLVI